MKILSIVVLAADRAVRHFEYACRTVVKEQCDTLVAIKYYLI